MSPIERLKKSSGKYPEAPPVRRTGVANDVVVTTRRRATTGLLARAIDNQVWRMRPVA